ncbi:MAG TPA: fumarylacetoacetate hydrolase family protein [Casimicrobiaceae bacterium]|nr:fumarylacetoacetate hydrolase family protein [Casimicrobiaceae bacterium]
MADITALAERVDDAARNAKEIPQLSEAITLEEAYAVQKQSVGRRFGRGEKQVGIKMGFTSRDKMVQMGVHDMIWGRLTDAMVVEDGGPTSFKRYVHPRIEPEIAFLLKSELVGTVTPLQALSAVEAVAPAIEIIDSRYKAFKFSLTDVVADNSSSSGFVVGAWHSPDVDFSNLGIVVSFNGNPVLVGSTAAILGHPLRSLVAAARFAAEAEEPLQSGWIVMAGGASHAEALKPGLWVECEVQNLGRCGFSVVE